MKLRHGSLFSGIGGFDLAAEWRGWENVFHCEWMEFPREVLSYHFPKSISYEDITKTDFTIHRGGIDVLTGGFPCQPYSVAGKRLGKEDERHLWPEMLRAIREIEPRFVVGENVRGLVNWNGGLVFDEVQADLEDAGYEVIPFILPACAVGAPHRRDRVWFIAYRKDARYEATKIISEREKCKPNNWEKLWNTPNSNGGIWDASNTNGERLRNKINRVGESEQFNKNSERNRWQNFPTQSPIRERNDGISNRLDGYITKELQDEISKTSKENRVENLQEVWERVQSEEIWESIRGLYSLESKGVLFKVLQLYSEANIQQVNISPFGEKFCEPILHHLRKHKEFRCSPQGQELEKQRSEQFGNSLSFLPHEVALAAGRFESAIKRYDGWHRNESIKGFGNAIVPQVAFEIFKSIEESFFNK